MLYAFQFKPAPQSLTLLTTPRPLQPIPSPPQATAAPIYILELLKKTLYSINKGRVFSFHFSCLGDTFYQLIFSNLFLLRSSVSSIISVYNFSTLPNPVTELTIFRETKVLTNILHWQDQLIHSLYIWLIHS